MIKKNRLSAIENQILRIKDDLLRIGEMRPGSLTEQFKDPKTKSGGFFQLSYTLKMKSKTEYVRRKNVADLKRQIAEYKRFRKLVDMWVDLAIEHSKSKIDLQNEQERKANK